MAHEIEDTLVFQGRRSSWGLTGDAGTNPTTDFLGTTDAQDLIIKTNNVERFRVKGTTGNLEYNGVLKPVSAPFAGALGLSSTANGGVITAYVNEGLSPTQTLTFDYQQTILNNNSGFGNPGYDQAAFKIEGNHIATGLGGGKYSELYLNSTINMAGNSNAGIYYGVRFEPTLNNITNTRVIGFTNTVGDNLLGTISGATSIGATTVIPTSSIFQVASTTQGSIPAPIMTTIQRNAITSPANGLQVYDITINKMCFYNGTEWRQLSDTVAP